MGSITTRVVNRVSSRPASSSATYIKADIDYDFAIAGIPLISGISKERPYIRKTAPYRKDQIDPTPIPGEQSMVFWWLRSQSSFHGGTGIIFEEPALEASILYADPNSATAIPLRYQDSEGVDVFTQPGHVTLLPATHVDITAAGQCFSMGATDASGTDCIFQAEGATLTHRSGSTNTAVTWGGTGTILAMTNDGTNYYVADNVGIWQGTLTGGAGSKLWNTGSSNVAMKWVKDRLVACIGLSVYELVGGSPPTLPTPLYTSQRPNYVWTAVEEGPDGIYLAGHDSSTSHIWFVGLTTGVGNTPVLSAPRLIAEMPAGETVYCLKEVMGSFLAIGSNLGIRIADFDGSGHISYGPLFCKLPSGAGPVYSITARDRFVIGAWSNGMADGTSGLVKIDLGFTTQFAHYAYAKDLQAHQAGAVRSVGLYGASNRLFFTVDGHGTYTENTTTGTGNVGDTWETSGFLQTGNIRFHTQELKLYKVIKIEGNLSVNDANATTVNATPTVVVTMSDSGGGTTSVVTFGSTTGAAEATLPAIGPMEWVNFTFTLTASTINSGSTGNGPGPTLYSYQVRALPAQKNQRMFLVPVAIFDKIKDKEGMTVGYEGYARSVLSQLEAFEEARDNVLFQDFGRNPFEQRIVVIDDIQFQQVDPPTNASGAGGYAQITLRTVD